MNEEHFPGVVAADRDGRVLADNAAAAQVPREALEAVTRYLEFDNAQQGARFERCEHTTYIVDEARRTFAELLDVPASTVGFGANATSIALDFSRTIAHVVRPGDRVVVTATDHYANVVPWVWLRKFGAKIDVVGVDSNGDLDDAAFTRALEAGPMLVALPWASNATGTVFDVAALSARAADAGALVVVDGVQAAPHLRIDVPETVDFAFFSAYKVFAPHFGAWYARPEAAERFFRADDDFLPGPEVNWSMETGTQSHEALAGWLGTVKYLRDNGDGSMRTAMDRFAAYERELARAALAKFAERADRIVLYGGATSRDRLPVFAFNVRGKTAADVAAKFDARKIEARAGDYYVPRLMKQLAWDFDGSAVRLSFAHYNTLEDVERCFAVLDSR